MEGAVRDRKSASTISRQPPPRKAMTVTTTARPLLSEFYVLARPYLRRTCVSVIEQPCDIDWRSDHRPGSFPDPASHAREVMKGCINFQPLQGDEAKARLRTARNIGQKDSKRACHSEDESIIGKDSVLCDTMQVCMHAHNDVWIRLDGNDK